LWGFVAPFVRSYGPLKHLKTRIEKLSAMQVQTFILALTLLAAVMIGLKQNEINEHLLNLNYYPELAITYDQATKRILITNEGKASVLFWGDKLGSAAKDIGKDSRVITPGSFYYLLTDKLQPYLLNLKSQSDDSYLLFDIFIESEDHKRYTVKNLLFFKPENGSFAIHTQTLYVAESDWSQ
jgi:hypothetical protein